MKSRFIAILSIFFSLLIIPVSQAEESPEAMSPDIVKELAEMGITSHILQVGDQAIDFELPNAIGQKVRLKELLKKGPVIVTWYRGIWCPYCNTAMRELQVAWPELKALGASVVAISPQTPDRTLSMAEKHKLEFEVLSDQDNGVARKYGLVYKVPASYLLMLKTVFVELEDYNGDDKHELPLTATYVINTDGTIYYAFIDPNYRVRANPKALIAVLEKMKSERIEKTLERFIKTP